MIHLDAITPDGRVVNIGCFRRAREAALFLLVLQAEAEYRRFRLIDDEVVVPFPRARHRAA